MMDVIFIIKKKKKKLSFGFRKSVSFFLITFFSEKKKKKMSGPPLAQKAREPILTLRFNGAAPPPHPPCTDPTPDEQFEIEVANRARIQAEKDAAEASKPKDDSAMGKIGGFFNKAAAVVEKAATNATDSSERKVRQWDFEQGEKNFTVNFPELVAAGAKFVTHYTGAVMHKGQKIPGTIFIASTHVAFVSDTLKDAFALAHIASIQRSCALKTVDNGPPFIMPIPAPQVMPNCIQFFMVDLRVIQFLEFDNVSDKTAQALSSYVKGRPVDRFYNFVDHMWRRATAVPVPGVTYATY